jgi:hypothetical protein
VQLQKDFLQGERFNFDLRSGRAFELAPMLFGPVSNDGYRVARLAAYG